MKTKLLKLSLLSLLVTSCGGGGGSSSDEEPVSIVDPNPNSSSTLLKTGIISGFGSIYVDGKRYHTDNANIVVNDAAGQPLTALKVGMKIQLTSTDSSADTPTATQVYYQTEIKGTVQEIDRNQRVIKVSGVDVKYDDLTHFIGISEVSLTIGQRVEVSGSALADGSFSASYIELEDDNDTYDIVSGVISNLDTAQMTFQIGELIVDYSSATIEGELSNNAQVRVKGSLQQATFVASAVKSANDDTDSPHDYDVEEIEGVIDSYAPDTRLITINGQTFKVSNQVTYKNGTSSDLAAGKLVELHISYSGQEPEVIKVEFKQGSYIDGKIKGSIDSIDYANKNLTINGQSYSANDNTRYEDDDHQYFNFNDLQTGDFIELVYKVETGENIILKIEREDENERYEDSEIKGAVSAYDSSSITVAGMSLPIITTANFIIDDLRVDLETFLATLEVGIFIEIEGNFDTNGGFNPSSYEIETKDDDDQDDNQHRYGHVELEGRVTELLTSTSFKLNGYEIDLSSATDLEIRDRQVSLSEFMATIKIDDIVEIEGYWESSSRIIADEAELDD